MKWTLVGWSSLACCVVLLLVLAADAASPLSNSLTGFVGDSSQAGTQAALTSAGFSVFDTGALPAVSYDAGGAHFGTMTAGDDGRNYMRTVDGDYAFVNFTAEITFTTTSDDQAVFIGMGSGNTALFGTPDWSTLLSSASFWPETANDKFTRFRTANDVNSFGDSTLPGFDPGTH